MSEEIYQRFNMDNIENLNRHNILNPIEWMEYKTALLNFLNQTQ